MCRAQRRASARSWTATGALVTIKTYAQRPPSTPRRKTTHDRDLDPVAIPWFLLYGSLHFDVDLFMSGAPFDMSFGETHDLHQPWAAHADPPDDPF